MTVTITLTYEDGIVKTVVVQNKTLLDVEQSLIEYVELARANYSGNVIITCEES